MNTIIDGLRTVLGSADFYLDNGSWDYAAMIEYIVGAIILCIVVSSIFRFIVKAVSR